MPILTNKFGYFVYFVPSWLVFNASFFSDFFTSM